MRELTEVGEAIPFTIGDTTITLQWVRPDAYTVTVYHGQHRIDDLCGSFDTEDAARLIARTYAKRYLAEAVTTDQPEATIAALMPSERRQPVRKRGVSRAHLADASDPQEAAIAIGRANGGFIPRTRRAGGMELSVLRPLVARGDADPVYDRSVSRFYWSGVQLRAHMLTDAA